MRKRAASIAEGVGSSVGRMDLPSQPDVPPVEPSEPGLPGAWLPDHWTHPAVVPVGPHHHLRPIRATDVDLDLAAVRGSRERLWAIYGTVWNWPPADLTREQDLEDLVRHAAEHEEHESFTYALLDAEETTLLGCVYIDPPGRAGADADVSWWVVDSLVGTELESRLGAFIPAWVASAWPLRRPRFIGRDLTWDAWLDLPELEAGA